MDNMERFLKPSPTIDSDNDSIRQKAIALTKGKQTATDKAKSLFYFVRDTIKYNPYVVLDKLEYYRASRILEVREGFCVQKALLLAALARAVGIPSRLHLADIRNHLASAKLMEVMRTDLFIYHGYTDLYLADKWVKATPAFDIKMCQKNRIIPVEFDGKHDAILHLHNLDGKLHIEYILDRGYYEDVPFDDIVTAFDKLYGLSTFREKWQRFVREEKKTAGGY